MITSRQQRGGIQSKFARFINTLKNWILPRGGDIQIDSYDVKLQQSKVEIIPFKIKKKAATTRDLSNITIPLIYEYTKVDATSFESHRIDGSGREGKDGGSLTYSVFNTLKSAEVKGYDFKDLSLSNRGRLFKIEGNGLGFGHIKGERLDPFHLALPSLYPKSAFDFRKLLDFPLGKSLYPFQRDGVTFLIERENALLADEMGLGKSIQAIVAARLLFKTTAVGKCLLVCPKSVFADWAGKFEEWAPELRVSKICGSASSRRNLWDRRSHVYLVTYDTLKEDVLNREEKEAAPLSFDLVILDEVQRIKNRSTKTFQTVNKIGGTIRWGLSGTPLENRIEDLTTIFSYLKPGLFRSNEVDNPLHVKSTIKPFILRRTKNAVLKDLPKKTHDKVLLDLGSKQRAAYNLAEKKGIIALKEKGKTATVTHVMALISKLKQICNIEPVSGESCKLEYIQDVLSNLYETGEKMVIFSQYPEKTLRLIKPRLKRFKPLMYHGSLTSRQREEVLKQFEEDENARVLLISLKAGSLGLTLTAANYVAHFDSWWNPATMSQAEDRTHRIGQKKNVFVASLITQGTVEERIQRILEEKRTLFKEVVGEISDEGLTRMLTEKELFGLFGLHRDKDSSESHDGMYISKRN